MYFIRHKNLKPYAQVLRREMTSEERTLWYLFLKPLEVTVYRQKMIGDYIVDFYCAQAKVVIEIDGSQHYEDEAVKQDLERDRFLNSLGITVLRYTNADIHKHFNNVCEDIYNHIFK